MPREHWTLARPKWVPTPARGNQKIDPTLKRNAETVFIKLGLSVSQAINLFFQQVHTYQSLPFESVETPNETTIKALKEAEAGEGVRFESTDQLFEELGIK